MAIRTITRRDLPNGATVTIEQKPQVGHLYSVLVRGSDLRIDIGASGRREMLMLKDSVWWQFVSHREDGTEEQVNLWKRRPEQMPGIGPLDPREFACDSIQQTVAGLLRSGEPVSTSIVRNETGHRLVRIVRQQDGCPRIRSLAAAL